MSGVALGMSGVAQRMRGVAQRMRMLNVPVVLALAFNGGCATVPNADPIIGQTTQGGAARITGRHGPLSAKQSKAILAHMDAKAHTDLLERHLRIEQAVSDTALVAGNEVRVLSDGIQTFPAMFSAMKAAKTRINLEYYIFEDIQSGEDHLADVLIQKRREGVEINIIYDSVGSSGTPAALFERLRSEGIKVLEFNPLNPLRARKLYSVNSRDHRKILLVDGTTAIVGGVNLSASYQSSPTEHKEEKPAESQKIEYWRDTDLQITGPVVAQLQKLFVEHWVSQNGPPLDDSHWATTTQSAGSEIVRILGTSPDKFISSYYITVLSAIRNADKHISLICAYFVPTHQEVEDLIEAARRGVAVRIVVPSKGDSPMALSVQHSHYAALLKAGVKIYETQNMVLHSKVLVVDGVWSIVGSSNFDHRSVLFNDEVDAVVLGTSTGGQLEAIVEDDVGHASLVDREAWRHRGLTERFKEVGARLSQRFL